MINTQQKSTRHCMIVHNYYPFAETRVQRQAEALANNDVKVDVICLHLGDEPQMETVAGVVVHRLPLQREKNAGSILKFLEYLTFFVYAFFKVSRLHWSQRYDVVQVHNLPDFLVFAALVPKLLGSKIILDLHDLMPEFYCAKFNSTMNSWPVRSIQWQEWLACRFSDHVITVTELWRQTLIGRGLNPEKCTVVMNVADLSSFGHQAVIPPKLQNDANFRLIYHGTITRRYGLDLVVQALRLIRNDNLSVQLIIRGRGDFLEPLLLLIEELDLSDSIDISTEYLSVSELTGLIKSADAAVVPYRRDIFTDGILPTKLMEYAALGVPTIVAKTPAITAYFNDTMVEFFTSGVVEELAHSIRDLYQNKSQLEKLAKNIQQFNHSYNWQKQKSEYITLIKQLGNSQFSTQREYLDEN